jgi:hypothetical protein
MFCKILITNKRTISMSWYRWGLGLRPGQSMWNWWWINNTGTGFRPSSSVLPCQNHSAVAPYLYIIWGWTIGPLVAAVQRHSLTPSAWKTNMSCYTDATGAYRQCCVLNGTQWTAQIVKLFTVQFSSAFCYFIPFTSKHFPHHPEKNTSNSAVLFFLPAPNHLPTYQCIWPSVCVCVCMCQAP